MPPARRCASWSAGEVAPRLRVETEDGPARRVVRVSGELDLATVDLLRRAVDAAVADHGGVELDLSGVTFCDVVGATAIEQALQQVEARGHELVLGGIDRPLRLILAVDGLFSTLQRSPGGDGTSSTPRGLTTRIPPPA